MERLREKGLMILKDNLQCSSERLWAALVLRATEEAKGPVRVYLLTSFKNTLKKRYPTVLQLSSAKEIDSLTDVLSDVSSESTGGTIFLDSVDTALLADPFDKVVALLAQISRHAVVIARIHDEYISAQNWERLNSVTEVALSLELDDKKVPVCTTVSYKKKNGKRVVKMEAVHVDDSLSVSFKPYKRKDTVESAKEDHKFVIPESSFDIGLHLKNSEREAKQHLLLPFEAAQKKEGVVGVSATGSRKVRAGGRIIYTPDEADDFDESDPDDDLEI